MLLLNLYSAIKLIYQSLQRFGVDYIAFCEKVEYCPLDFLRLAFTCCQVRHILRWTFFEIN